MSLHSALLLERFGQKYRTYRLNEARHSPLTTPFGSVG
jgi:hypothetical protein